MSKKELYTGPAACIHLGACRRYAAIVRNITGNSVRRGCNEKECSMYQSRAQLEEEINEFLADKKKFLREEMTAQYIPYNEIVSEAINGIYVDVDNMLK